MSIRVEHFLREVDELDALELQSRGDRTANFGYRDARGFIERKTVAATADRREREASDPVLAAELEAGSVA